jgi:hypothetical protein
MWVEEGLVALWAMEKVSAKEPRLWRVRGSLERHYQATSLVKGTYQSCPCLALSDERRSGSE